MMRMSFGGPAMGAWLATAVTLLLVGGALATATGTTPASAAPADTVAPGASSALGLSSTLGGFDIAEARASYPEGPLRDAVDSVEVGTAARADAASGVALGATAGVTGDDTTGETAARAGIAELTLRLGGGALTTGPVSVDCSAGPGRAPTGAASLTEAGLALPGHDPLTFDEAPAADTVVSLPDGLGRVVLNEWIVGADGALTVNALRLETADGELTLGTATCRGGGPAAEAA